MSVLEELVAAARGRSFEPAELGPPVRSAAPGFADSLRGRGRLAVIAEVKRASPSAGVLAAGIDPLEQARAYHRGGAAAISVLTEPTRFGGSLGDLRRVAGGSPLPALMKDFVVVPDQVRAARRLGARAVLLIARILPGALLGELLAAAGEEGLDVLVECHTGAEIERALAAGAGLVGVNNRDLDTLAVDTSVALRLLPGLPDEVVAVAESGYAGGADVEPLRGLADAVLVGSALMTAADPAARIAELAG